MQQFDKILDRIKEAGFKFTTGEMEWGKRYLGTKERGAFRKPEKVLIAHFERTNPSPVQFGSFIRDAEKLCEKDGLDYIVKDILLVTPSDIDRRKQDFRIFLEKANKDALAHVKYKSLGIPESAPEPTPVPPALTVARALVSPPEVDLLLQNRTSKERTLLVITSTLEKSGTRTSVALAITQERGVVLRQVGDQLVPFGLEFRWEQLAHVDAESQSNGEPSLVINDMKKVYEFSHPEAEFLARLLGHLKWAREGYLTGFVEEHGFDSDLISKTRKDMLDGRYTDAVRNAFALLESRIRHDSFAPATLHGRELIDYAFSANNGKINFGRVEPEKNGLYMLFSGTFAWLRNPASHTSELRDFGREEAFEVLALINHLLKLSSRGSEEARNRPT